MATDADFDAAFTRLMGNEGSYSNNPADPGGETMWGITARVARAHGYTSPMKDLDQATAKDIARAEYWDKFRCHQFDPRIAFMLFDTAYNGGHPVQWLQRAIGAIEDGIVGTETVSLAAAADPSKVCSKFSGYRMHYYTSLPTWPSFGKGWANRIADNLIAMAS